MMLANHAALRDELANHAALRDELADCRKRIDLALGRALQLVDLLEAEQIELQRDQRLTAAERDALAGGT